MNSDKLKALAIDKSQKSRPQGVFWGLVLVILLITLGALYFARPKPGDNVRVINRSGHPDTTATNNKIATVPTKSVSATAQPTPNNNSTVTPPPTASADDPVLTVSGYIVNRERIELSPRFMGMVTWIGVKKGDTVTNGQVVVLLDDTEYRARLAQAEAAVATAHANAAKAQATYQRITNLTVIAVESKQTEDDARLNLEAVRAGLRESEAMRDVAQTYLAWCTIRSPINGVVLEKLVDPNELVTPQSFGGTRGPSTALIAVADPQDLQVEIDMNEADLSKVSLNQKCRVSPEAFLEKTYEGYVAEMAPEANRAKGTLQIKVQIRNPDKFLTPELSAKVEFFKQ